MGKPLQVVFDGSAFGIRRTFGLEEVGFYHVGIGIFSNVFNDFNRKSSIHCGSFFTFEIVRTTSSLNPIPVS